ncbi:MAG: hypothetical protein ACKO4T_09095 [Planctomycetaceae bacterium]
MTDRTIAGVPLEDVILVAQAVASAAMCGLIWFVQGVHYPMFAAITGPRSRDYALENQRRTTPVVLPFMLVELATAAALACWPPDGIGRGPAAAGLALVAVIWLSTFLAQVPLHARLAGEGHAPGVVAALVRGNWVRTVAWTARALLAAWMLRVAG